ncbi:hypothetical protein ACFP1Z_28045 [Streptomyces gamaensis]|uniref:DUF8094 domain-containing protein n=1 Tax=Streptomyces gamaensis TaxID=1763542 RepID=A0ABW0Z5D2_9ACTN
MRPRSIGPRSYGHRRRRALLALAAALPLLAATGCVTVHGERELLPAVSRDEAPQVLEAFNDGYNEAYSKLDPAVIDRVETGPLAEIGHADMTTQSALTPGGNPGYPVLVLDDARFTIPRQAGWPKFFLADTRSNRDGNRWFVLFTQERARAPWKAAYLSILSQDKVPEFALDKDGWAEPVPAVRGADPKLAFAPDEVSSTYTTYLRTGDEKLFAPGRRTSELREEREKLRRTPTFWTDYIDVPEHAPAFPAPALRTKDGGALVFFTAHHHEKRTMAQGVQPTIADRRTQSLLNGEPRTAVTFTRVAESAVRVPSKAAGGPIMMLNRIEGLTAAKGE